MTRRIRSIGVIAFALAALSCTPSDATLQLRAPTGDRAGLVPTFRWEAVDGAASYRLVLLDAAAFPVWSWQGSGTSVPLLGFEHDASVGGPVVTDGSTWSVAALDASGVVLAISEPAVVSPGVPVPPIAPIATQPDRSEPPGGALPEDPCRLLALDDVNPFFGGAAPAPQVATLEGAVECRMEQGPFGYLRLTIATSSSDRLPGSLCTDCEAVDVGDDARGRTAPSGGILYAVSGGLLLTAESTGLGEVTLDQLMALVRAAISRL